MPVSPFWSALIAVAILTVPTFVHYALAARRGAASQPSPFPRAHPRG